MIYEGTSYNGRDWMIGWNTSTGEVMVVGPYPDLTRWANGYESTTGCCYRRIDDLTDEEVAECLRGEALHMMSRGVPSETGGSHKPDMETSESSPKSAYGEKCE